MEYLRKRISVTPKCKQGNCRLTKVIKYWKAPANQATDQLTEKRGVEARSKTPFGKLAVRKMAD